MVGQVVGFCDWSTMTTVSRGFQVTVLYGRLPVSPLLLILGRRPGGFAGPIGLVRLVSLFFKRQQLRMLSISDVLNG